MPHLLHNSNSGNKQHSPNHKDMKPQSSLDEEHHDSTEFLDPSLDGSDFHLGGMEHDGRRSSSLVVEEFLDPALDGSDIHLGHAVQLEMMKDGLHDTITDVTHRRLRRSSGSSTNSNSNSNGNGSARDDQHHKEKDALDEENHESTSTTTTFSAIASYADIGDFLEEARDRLQVAALQHNNNTSSSCNNNCSKDNRFQVGVSAYPNNMKPLFMGRCGHRRRLGAVIRVQIPDDKVVMAQLQLHLPTKRIIRTTRKSGTTSKIPKDAVVVKNKLKRTTKHLEHRQKVAAVRMKKRYLSHHENAMAPTKDIRKKKKKAITSSATTTTSATTRMGGRSSSMRRPKDEAPYEVIYRRLDGHIGDLPNGITSADISEKEDQENNQQQDAMLEQPSPDDESPERFHRRRGKLLPVFWQCLLQGGKNKNKNKNRQDRHTSTSSQRNE